MKIDELVADLVAHYKMSGKMKFAADTETRWQLHLKPWFASVQPVNLTTSRMRDYRIKRLEEGAAQATINRELQILRKSFNLAMECEPPKVQRVPKFKFVKEDNARQGFISNDQLERIRKAAAEDSLWMQTLVEAAFLWGWRKSEILCLTPSHINLSDRVVRLRKTKNGDPREVPLTDTLAKLFAELMKTKTEHTRIFPSDIRAGWRRVCEKAQVNALFHDFRRTSARSKRHAGVDTSVIMSIMGWKSEAMFRRYAIVSVADKLEALNKVSVGYLADGNNPQVIGAQGVEP